VVCFTDKCPRSRTCARPKNSALQTVVTELTGGFWNSHARFFRTAYHPSYGPTYSVHLWRLRHPSRLWVHISNINLDWSMVFGMDNPVARRAETRQFRQIWHSQSSGYEHNEANVFCDTTHNSHLSGNSTSHPIRQLLARLSKLKYTLPYGSS
jgi:hypothetical protein